MNDIRPIPGFDNLWINTSADVWRWCKRNQNAAPKFRRLKQQTVHGYKQISIRVNGKVIYLRIARLMLMAFVGPPPTPRHQADHINHIRDDNRIENLQWLTPAENTSRQPRIVAIKLRNAGKTATQLRTEAQYRWNAKNADKLAAYRLRTREQVAAQKREYYIQHREQIAARQRDYYQKNREHRLAYQRNYEREKRQLKTQAAGPG